MDSTAVVPAVDAPLSEREQRLLLRVAELEEKLRVARADRDDYVRYWRNVVADGERKTQRIAELTAALSRLGLKLDG